jgi:3-methylfumaryl-CoA hydratase
MSTQSPSLVARQLEQWRSHVGRVRIQRETLDVSVLRRFAVVCGADAEVEKTHPPMAHWAYFLDAVASGGLGEDGHPLRGDFLPAVHLPRRMFAAASIRFEQPLELGREAECLTRIADVKCKSGQSGELVFVELERTIMQSQQTRVRESQTIVYRAAGTRQPAVVAGLAQTGADGVWCPGPVDLFRFSAVTFNAHRIHYDAHYAQHVEGYPDLVVHGPFAAVKLLAFAQQRSARAVQSFAFRLVAPLFVSQPVTFASGEEPGSFVALRCDGVHSVSAKVEFQ